MISRANYIRATQKLEAKYYSQLEALGVIVLPFASRVYACVCSLPDAQVFARRKKCKKQHA